MEFKANILVLDTETGGLDCKKTPIIEIACCPFYSQTLDNVKEFESLIIAPYDTTKEYTEGALRANGITMNQIENGIDSKAVIEKICEYLSSLKIGREKPILSGHNLKFDIGFLVEFFDFHKKNFLDFINPDFQIDTLWWSRMKFIESTNYKLGTCCENVGIELNDGAHRAIHDTRANRDLVKDFIRSLRSDKRGEGDKEYVRPRFQF